MQENFYTAVLICFGVFFSKVFLKLYFLSHNHDIYLFFCQKLLFTSSFQQKKPLPLQTLGSLNNCNACLKTAWKMLQNQVNHLMTRLILVTIVILGSNIVFSWRLPMHCGCKTGKNFSFLNIFINKWDIKKHILLYKL